MSAAPVKRRVLLVDDEPKIVDGLRRTLRPHRAVWDVETATSGAAALEVLATHPFDVIVTDMRMPLMDGAALLTAAKQRYPAMMRIVLSGQTDADAALRAVPVAHQFLSKPTDPVVLLESLNRVVSTKDAIADVRVLGALGSVDALPSPMAVCNELTALMNRDDASASAVAALIEQDPAIVLKLLQVVNSAFFGLRRQTYSIVDAVAYLGTELVKNLVTSLTIINALPVKAQRFDASRFHEHAIAVARMARQVGHIVELGDTSFVAGMLHEVGKLVMAFAMPELYDEVAQRAEADGGTFEEAERAGGTCGHAKIGAYLLDLWGLPYTVVEALVDHDRDALDHTKLRAADAVRVAHLLLASPAGGGEDKEERAYLARLGLLEHLPLLVEAASGNAGRT